MKIGLIDCDYGSGKKPFPNLALMKISGWWKYAGADVVEWYDFTSHYDIVYVSKVFSWTEDYRMPINADKIIRGGSGYQIRLQDGKEVWKHAIPFGNGFQPYLPYEIEHMYPDYSIYGITDTAYGFLTRGCPRGCAFCHVAKKEGCKSIKVAGLSEFWHGQKNIVLLDPNLLACKDRIDLLQQLIDSGCRIDFTQGLDARMLDDQTCDMLSEMRIKNIHFAWDKYEDGDVILPKLEMFAKRKYAGKNPNHNAIVYTLTNFDTTVDEDLDRIYRLRDMGYWAYVMIYDKQNADKEHKDMQRWANNRKIFAVCPDFRQYKKLKK